MSRRRNPRLHLAVDSIRELELLVGRLERAALAEWRAHPVLGSDVMLAVAYLRRLLAAWGTP
jgi:hypothetical protein